MNKGEFLAGIALILILATAVTTSPARSKQRIWEELEDIKRGISKGFGDQWELIQRLRYQGVKRHKGLIQIFRELMKLSEEIEYLKSSPVCCNNEKVVKKSAHSCAAPFENIEGSCFLFGKKRRSWDSAVSFCRSAGGYLFDGRNATTLNVIRRHLTKFFNGQDYLSTGRFIWVGGKNHEGRWLWVTHKKSESNTTGTMPNENDYAPIDASAWAPLEPKKRTLGMSPLCMALDADKDYKGATTFCKYFRKFVCEM